MPKQPSPMNPPPLYRGLLAPLPPGGEHAFIPEDRPPRTTGQHVAFNICFNLMVEHRFRIPLVRRRSLFVSGDLHSALRYAARPEATYIGVVQPADPFRFLYSPAVADSASLVDELTRRYLECFEGFRLADYRPLLEDPRLTLTAIDRFFSDHPDLDIAPSSAGAAGRSLSRRLYEMLEDCFAQGNSMISAYTDIDLEAAAASKAEVLIFDCPGGYWIRPIDPALLAAARGEVVKAQDLAFPGSGGN